ncbi:efflux RND transporter permease subunit, partial [Vibrio sp. 1288]|uniref:efflux RND transporter permease subunit n=1 Tax=Vibrio sp. 1288 TaxID=3074550 RepID=UPI0029666AE7
LSGVSVADINNTLITAANAKVLGYIADPREVDPLPIEVQLRREDRDNLNQLEQLYVRGRPGIAKVESNGAVVDAPQPIVQLSEVGHFVKRAADKPIFHKNLKPVVYVYAEVVGRVPGEVIADVMADQDTTHAEDVHRHWQDRTYLSNGAGVTWSVPDNIEVVWSGEGEWKIIVVVVRDLGI